MTSNDNMDLPDNFWSTPVFARITVNQKRAQYIKEKHNNRIFACGESWIIKTKHVGAGMYELWLGRTYPLPSAKKK